MNKKALVIGLVAALSSGLAVAGGSTGAQRYEPAARAPAPQPAPVVQQQAPAPAPVVTQTTTARTPAPVVIAAAAPRNYVGIGVGRAESDLAGDEDDTVGKIFAGTNFNQNLGAELTYQDLGDLGGSDDGVVSLAAVGRLPVLANTNVFGKVGGYHKIDSDFGDDNGLLLGVGAEMGFSRNMAVRAEFERLQDAAANIAGAEEDIDVASLSLVWKF